MSTPRPGPGSPSARPAPVHRLLKRARDAARDGDPEGALRDYEQARDADPGNRELLLELGRAYVERFRVEAALATFRTLAKAGPLSAEECYGIGKVWQENGMPDEAEPALRMTARLAPREIAPWLRLAQLEDRRHRLKQACRAAEHALALDPSSQDARCLWAGIALRAGRVDEAETRLRDLLAEPVRSADAHWRGWHHLGKLLDGTGRYPEAMKSFRKGKKLLARQAKPHQARATREAGQMRRLTTGLTREHIARWRDERASAPDPSRRVLLCGHPRTGTTLMETILEAHRDVITADESPVFSQEVSNALLRLARNRKDRSLLETLDRVPTELRDQWANQYAAQMHRWLREPVGARWLVDKNPILTPQLPIASRVFPDMRYLVMLRDPRDVILSCFMQPLPLNAVSVHYLTLESAARQYVRVMDAWRRFRDQLPDSQWLEINYRDLVHELPGQARRVLDFLELPWHRRILRFHKTGHRGILQSPSYGDVTRPAYTHALHRWEHYAPFIKPCEKILAPVVRT